MEDIRAIKSLISKLLPKNANYSSEKLDLMAKKFKDILSDKEAELHQKNSNTS